MKKNPYEKYLESIINKNEENQDFSYLDVVSLDESFVIVFFK